MLLYSIFCHDLFMKPGTLNTMVIEHITSGVASREADRLLTGVSDMVLDTKVICYKSYRKLLQVSALHDKSRYVENSRFKTSILYGGVQPQHDGQIEDILTQVLS